MGSRVSQLLRLRTQMLLAMGVPSCWNGPVPVAPQPPTTTAQPPLRVDFDPRACSIDAIPETVCGHLGDGHKTCGARADRLDDFDRTELYVSDAAAARKFGFDRLGTSTYVAELEDDNDELADQSCCYSRCSTLTVARSAPAIAMPANHHTEQRCIPIPPNGTTVPSADPACPAAVRLDPALVPYVTTVEGKCCYLAIVPDPIRRVIRGRAARVDGTARFADLGTGGTSWRSSSIAQFEPCTLAPALRTRLATAWLEVARMEHASIASFAHLALQLLALGAPADLVARSHAAALDEIRHAQLAFSLASTYADAPLGPAAFPDAARMTLLPPATLAQLALDTFIDGCIGETTAALEAHHAAHTTDDPQVANALHALALDETRHAELAWAILAWCVRTDPSLLHGLQAALRSLPDPASTDDTIDLEAHGILGAASFAQVRADVLHGVVAPCLAALAPSPGL